MGSVNLSGGPCKIRLIDAHGSRVVRICEPGQIKAETKRYIADGLRLDTHELAVGKGHRTTNPSRL